MSLHTIINYVWLHDQPVLAEVLFVFPLLPVLVGMVGDSLSLHRATVTGASIGLPLEPITADHRWDPVITVGGVTSPHTLKNKCNTAQLST